MRIEHGHVVRYYSRCRSAQLPHGEKLDVDVGLHERGQFGAERADAGRRCYALIHQARHFDTQQPCGRLSIKPQFGVPRQTAWLTGFLAVDNQ